MSRRNDKGYVRGYDVRTGKRLWIFHTIPRPGEFGYDTWEQDSEEYTGNTGVWAQMSVDEELGLVFLPIEMPTGDYYGGHRPGDEPVRRQPRRARSEDRQAQVALPVHPARHLGLGSAVRADPRRRHDRRPACGRSSRSRPSRAGCTSSIASRASRSGRSKSARSKRRTCPTEKAHPTQPFVTKPPAYERQGVTIDDLIDFTPELRAEAVKLVSRFKIGPIFTPPVVSKWRRSARRR